MPDIVPPQTFYGLDPVNLGKNWTQNVEGSQRRQLCRAASIRSLTSAINFLAARQPRTITSVGMLSGYKGASAGDPVFQFRLDDNVENSTEVCFSMLALPRENGSLTDGVAVTESRLYNRSTGATSTFDDRIFTDGGATFTTTGQFKISPGDYLRINTATGDEGYYQIKEVVNTTQLKITRDWPVGSLSSLSYEIFTAATSLAQGDLVSTSPTYPNDLVHLRIVWRRTGPPSSERNFNLETTGGLHLVDVHVCDMPLDALKQGVHPYRVPTNIPNPGESVVNNIFEQQRSVLHNLRFNNLSHVAGWCAVTPTNFNRPVSSGIQGIRVTSTSFVNLLDSGVTSRTADSPGQSMFGYRSGVGYESITDNRKVKIQCRVLGETLSGSNGTVRFEGSSTFASNFTDVTITAGSGLAWYGSSSNYFYLDAGTDDDDATTARNKVDIFGKTPSSNMYIYGWQCWPEYGPP